MARVVTLESLQKKLNKATDAFSAADIALRKAQKEYDEAKAAVDSINAEITKLEFADFHRKLMASGKSMEDLWAFLENK